MAKKKFFIFIENESILCGTTLVEWIKMSFTSRRAKKKQQKKRAVLAKRFQTFSVAHLSMMVMRVT